VDDIMPAAGDLSTGNDERLSVDLFVKGDNGPELEIADIGRRQDRFMSVPSIPSIGVVLT
jgi:hypothetical protein